MKQRHTFEVNVERGVRGAQLIEKFPGSAAVRAVRLGENHWQRRIRELQLEWRQRETERQREREGEQRAKEI